MATAKRQVYQDWERTLSESNSEAARLVAALRDGSSDFREGVQSFVEKRPARFAAFAAPTEYEEFPDYVRAGS
jgi:enoyl-CoA hydratase/carnithine racemase